MDNNQQNDFNYNESNSRPESYGSNQSGTFRNANGTYHIPVWLIIVGFVLNWLLGLGKILRRKKQTLKLFSWFWEFLLWWAE